MKNTLPHLVNYEMIIFDKKKRSFEKCDITAINLEKTLEHLKTQESSLFENLTEY